MTLLRFTSIFTFLYMIFTIITGAFDKNVKNLQALNVAYGVMSVLQITLQVFMSLTKESLLKGKAQYS